MLLAYPTQRVEAGGGGGIHSSVQKIVCSVRVVVV